MEMERFLIVIHLQFVLSAKVIVHDAFRLNAKRIEHLNNSIRHGARTAHVVLDIFGCLVILQIGVIHHLMDETWCVLHACCICSWIGTVEGKMEVEV